MRWIAFGSAGLVFALLPVAAAPQPKDPPRPALYEATAVGTEWVYSYKAGIDTSRVKRTIVGAEPRDEGILVSIDREWEGKTGPDSRVLVSADGLLALPRPGKERTASLWLLKRPVVRGQSWELPREACCPVPPYGRLLDGFRSHAVTRGAVGRRTAGGILRHSRGVPRPLRQPVGFGAAKVS